MELRHESFECRRRTAPGTTPCIVRRRYPFHRDMPPGSEQRHIILMLPAILDVYCLGRRGLCLYTIKTYGRLELNGWMLPLHAPFNLRSCIQIILRYESRMMLFNCSPRTTSTVRIESFKSAVKRVVISGASKLWNSVSNIASSMAVRQIACLTC